MSSVLAPNLRGGADPMGWPVSKPETRFTLNGSDAIERQLTVLCQEVLARIRRLIPEQKLEGLALGGGYGRGEGGVLETPLGDVPYNDLEFYVFVCGGSWLNERHYASSLHELMADQAGTAGVELEFKIISRAKLRRSPQNLFYHDLLMGHRWLLGDDGLFAGCEHHREAKTLPLSEATRLLMNRCSGLLFAREKLGDEQFSAEDADFVCRNLAKTELALGDAVLIACGEYHWSCLERGRRLGGLVALEQLPWIGEVRKRHAVGIEFKLQPYRSGLSREVLQEQFREVSALALRVWLWLENQRLGCDFRSGADYAASPINKWPATSGWRNLLANAKVFGPRALLLPGIGRHPRERILNALVLLLWVRTENPPGIDQTVRRQLLPAGSTGIISAYRDRWNRAS